LAKTFSAENPGLTIEIVPIEADEEDPLAWVVQNSLDGAALPPSETALAGGWVLDLTEFIETDTDFDQADFYEQIWRGAWWRERMWFVPERASMQLLFYDKESYRTAEMPEPSLRWTWDEMAQDLSVLSISQPSRAGMTWGFLDVTRDSLYSYAYNWKNNCTQDSAIQCSQPLDNAQITAALEWYMDLLNQPETMPDLTVLPHEERQRMMVNWRAVFWVDTLIPELPDPSGVARSTRHHGKWAGPRQQRPFPGQHRRRWWL
jgi:ABC-type glycerol-3-phosphate transport system substrate-binding protein